MQKLKYIKYLGIDWGKKRIGLALADSETKIAIPFKVVSDIKEILNIVKEEEINEIIIGLPVKMSGAKDEQLEVYKNFVQHLKRRSGIAVRTIDERLTTKEANALAGSKRTKARQDAIAAMLILQGYLETIYARNS